MAAIALALLSLSVRFFVLSQYVKDPFFVVRSGVEPPNVMTSYFLLRLSV